MRPIRFTLSGTASTTVNSAIPVVNWTTQAAATGGPLNYILLNSDPEDDLIVVGSSITTTYLIGGTYTGTVTGIKYTGNTGVFVSPNTTDNIGLGATVSGTNVNAGGNGQFFIGLTSLAGIQVGDVVSGPASIPANTTVVSLDTIHNSVFLNNALTGNIAPGVAITFTPTSQLTTQLVPLDLYISPQNVAWAFSGGTVTATGYVGPLTNLVSVGTVTTPIINGAYTALLFTNTASTEALVSVEQSGITT